MQSLNAMNMRNTILLMLSVALLAACSAKQPKLEDECLYSPSKTQFCFWSNVAEQMEVLIYDEADSQMGEAISLQKGENDFWTATVKGDQVGKYYTVRSFQNGEWSLESPGIFAKAVSINGQRAAIIDMKATDPEGWNQDVRPAMPDRAREREKQRGWTR